MARPRKRAVSASYEKRNQRARSLGYKSYYDYRAHDNGRLAPTAPRLRGERLARARGHRSGSDLRRAIRDGSLVFTSDTSVRGKDGRFKWVEVTVLDDQTGSEKTFYLQGRQVTSANLRRIADYATDHGAVVGVWYPTDRAAA